MKRSPAPYIKVPGPFYPAKIQQRKEEDYLEGCFGNRSFVNTQGFFWEFHETPGSLILGFHKPQVKFYFWEFVKKSSSPQVFNDLPWCNFERHILGEVWRNTGKYYGLISSQHPSISCTEEDFKYLVSWTIR